MTVVIFLVIIGWSNGGVDHIPMKDMDSCKTYADQLKGFYVDTKCIEGIKP
jgi:hypothetical protein